MNTNNAEKHNARISIRIGQIPSLHVLRFSAFFMCMRFAYDRLETGLNISIGIGRFDYANIGKSDIGIIPESVVL